ncbi:hypothetical protein HPB47_001748 [Ixodes persulcatus]|uniref:Uncharacterized protein n=1 Tax=Ixodes persulcatus TaxID=34615 RepID=A0AC60PPE9_IXOPE|nr:hypothetical protein HPB47_001748 [Ixodes persulcatus]
MGRFPETVAHRPPPSPTRGQDTRLREAGAKVVCCLTRGAPKGPNLPRVRLNHQDALFPGHGLATHSQTWWLGSVVTLLTKHLAPKVQAPPAGLGVRGDATLQTPAFTGIVKEGGTAANIIPEHTEMEFTFRAKDSKNLLVLKEKLESCFRAAATATGCSVEIKDGGPLVENLISNKPMSKVFEAFARAVGFPSESGLDENTGSTDAGNVSHVLPTLHPMFELNSTGINHTAEFAKATNTPESFDLTLKTAKALALTALEVMRDPEFLKEIKKQFEIDTADDMVKARSRL